MKKSIREIMNGLKLHPKKTTSLIAIAFLLINLLSFGVSKAQDNAPDQVKSKEKKELKDLSSKELKREAKTNPEAQVLLADGYKAWGEYYDSQRGWSSYAPINYKAAYKLYLKAANANNASAQYKLGLMIKNSIGCSYGSPLRYEQSLLWLNKAADQNLAEAQFELAMIYFNGIKEEGNTMVPRDIDKGMALYQKAAEKDYPPAQYYLAMRYRSGEIGYFEKDLEKYRFWILKAANNNNWDAQKDLAKELSWGWGGCLNQDLEQAMFWAKKLLANPTKDAHINPNDATWVMEDVQKCIQYHLRDVEAAKGGAAGIAKLAEDRKNEDLAVDERLKKWRSDIDKSFEEAARKKAANEIIAEKENKQRKDELKWAYADLEKTADRITKEQNEGMRKLNAIANPDSYDARMLAQEARDKSKSTSTTTSSSSNSSSSDAGSSSSNSGSSGASSKVSNDQGGSTNPAKPGKYFVIDAELNTAPSDPKETTVISNVVYAECFTNNWGDRNTLGYQFETFYKAYYGKAGLKNINCFGFDTKDGAINRRRELIAKANNNTSVYFNDRPQIVGNFTATCGN